VCATNSHCHTVTVTESWWCCVWVCVGLLSTCEHMVSDLRWCSNITPLTLSHSLTLSLPLSLTSLASAVMHKWTTGVSGSGVECRSRRGGLEYGRKGGENSGMSS
jgi:hypothetical protein